MHIITSYDIIEHDSNSNIVLAVTDGESMQYPPGILFGPLVEIEDNATEAGETWMTRDSELLKPKRIKNEQTGEKGLMLNKDFILLGFPEYNAKGEFIVIDDKEFVLRVFFVRPSHSSQIHH